jgi:hypothetical protein
MPRKLKAAEATAPPEENLSSDQGFALQELASAADAAAWMLGEGYHHIEDGCDGVEQTSRVWTNVREALAAHVQEKIAAARLEFPEPLESFEVPKAGGRG